MEMPPVHVEPWVREILVDPLGKGPLTINEAGKIINSRFGMKFPIINGIFDLRLLKNEITADQKLWKEGQVAFEEWAKTVADQDHTKDYLKEIAGVAEVYQDIPVEGRCLDVGGHQGRLRHFLKPGQQYISCDPFHTVFYRLAEQKNLLNAYPFLKENVNFICCDAEFLPFKDGTFDTVHMRSVIDHFLNPELAMLEAYRVLKTNGALIIGIYVHGGKSGSMDMKTAAKETLRSILGVVGIEKFKDHHIWHPTYAELTEMVTKLGFKIDKVHWQKGLNDTVCYLKAVKCDGYMRGQ